MTAIDNVEMDISESFGIVDDRTLLQALNDVQYTDQRVWKMEIESKVPMSHQVWRVSREMQEKSVMETFMKAYETHRILEKGRATIPVQMEMQEGEAVPVHIPATKEERAANTELVRSVESCLLVEREDETKRKYWPLMELLVANPVPVDLIEMALANISEKFPERFEALFFAVCEKIPALMTGMETDWVAQICDSVAVMKAVRQARGEFHEFTLEDAAFSGRNELVKYVSQYQGWEEGKALRDALSGGHIETAKLCESLGCPLVMLLSKDIPYLESDEGLKYAVENYGYQLDEEDLQAVLEGGDAGNCVQRLKYLAEHDLVPSVKKFWRLMARFLTRSVDHETCEQIEEDKEMENAAMPVLEYFIKQYKPRTMCVKLGRRTRLHPELVKKLVEAGYGLRVTAKDALLRQLGELKKVECKIDDLDIANVFGDYIIRGYEVMLTK